MTQNEYGRSGTDTTADRMTDTARAQAEQARSEARGLTEEARGAASDVAGEAREAGSAIRDQAAGLAGTVKDQLARQAQAQKDNLAGRIGAVAQQVHSAADELRERESWLAELLDRGARELDHFADDFKNRDLASVAGSVENFARRQPALFMGAAVAVGFALTRLARSGLEGSSSGYGAGDQGQSRARGDTGYGSTSGDPGSTGRYGAGYVDERGDRPDVGSTWPETRTGYGGSGAGHAAAGSAGSTPSLGLGQGTSVPGSRLATTGSQATGAGEQSVSIPSSNEAGRKASSGETDQGADLARGSNV